MDKNAMLAMALPDGLWAGTESTLHSLVARLMAIHERPIPEAAMGYSSVTAQKEEPPPYLLSMQGSIAVIDIKGAMTNATSWWDRYDKVSTYPAIREALVYAAQSPSVKGILLDIESGGGAVAGMFDTANMIRHINDNVKPVVAFGETMFSAAYCLGCAAGQVFSSKSSGVGSIGIIATHMDYSKMYADMGINVTVMRSGKYKALVNRFEPLTDASREQFQDGMDANYDVFIEHVASMRDTTKQTADNKMAQGREFYGQAAQEAGLVDAITSFDQVLAALQESVDKQH
jgi:hypothetical protein